MRGGQYAAERLEELSVGRPAIRRLGQHHSEPTAQQRVPHRLGGKLDGERNEPAGLPRPGAGARDRGVLLEQREQESAFRWKLPVDGALGEARGLGDFVERGELDASLCEHGETTLDEVAQTAGFTKGAIYRQFRSEEHTSELQSRSDLVCRLLLEK